MRWSLSSVQPKTMVGNILHGILLTFGSGILLLLAGFAGWQFGLVWLATGLYALAAKAILLAFSLLLLLQVGLMLQTFYQWVSLYFRRETTALRRLATLQMRRRDARQRFMLERRQIYYLNHLKRQRLLAADDKKHSVELFKVINAELKHCMAPTYYKAVHKELKQHHKQADSRAMLALRKQVLCRSSITG